MQTITVQSATGPGARPRRLPTVTLTAFALVAISVVGGVLAVAFDVNANLAEAFGNHAEMASPLPVLVLTLLGGLAAARWRGWRGALGTLGVLVPCLLALGSMSDDESFKSGLPGGALAYQIFIFATCALAIIPCVRHLRTLRRESVVR